MLYCPTVSPALLSRKPFQTAMLRYRLGVIRAATGKHEKITNWSPNLIQDCGLNGVVNINWGDNISYMHLGNSVSPVPVRRDSGTTNLTQTGNSVVSIAGFFQSSDVGRLIKYNDGPGTEVYITAFTSSTIVTVGGPSQSIGPVNATVWYVNETALTTQFASSNNWQSGSTTTVTGNILTHTINHLSDPAASGTTLTEIGFSNGSTNVNLFDRDIITGGLTISTGDQVTCQVELLVTYNPTTPLSYSNNATGYNNAGQIQIEALNLYAPSGGSQAVYGIGSPLNNAYCLEPAWNLTGNSILAITASSPTFNVFNATGFTPTRAAVPRTSQTKGSYISGSFSIKFTGNWDVSTANSTITGFGIGFSPSSNYSSFLTALLTTPFAKNNTQTLSTEFTYSWSRTLTN